MGYNLMRSLRWPVTKAKQTLRKKATQNKTITMKIYTKQGDQGETGLLGGTRVHKDDICLKVIGGLDELNCSLGVVLSHGISPENENALKRIQEDLFVLGAGLAAAYSQSPRGLRLAESDVKTLEVNIDRMDERLPAMDAFILPGGVPVAASLHLSRAICRRAERSLVSFIRSLDNDACFAIEITYVNRLSDLLFVMARFENMRLSGMETKWLPQQSREE